MNKQELVDFSNKRNGDLGPKFSSYNDYIKWQTVDGCSFETFNEPWKNGQKNYIDKNFKDLDRDLVIADMCCGDGVGLNLFKEMGFKNIVGFEIADNKIEMAKSYGYRIVKQDVCSEEFSDEFIDKFDVLYSSHTMEHVLNPEYSIKNMLKTLKKGGLFYLVVPYPNVICSDITHTHGYMVHCGSMPLGLHITDDAKTTQSILEGLGLEVIDKHFDSFREQEVWFKLIKNKIV